MSTSLLLCLQLLLVIASVSAQLPTSASDLASSASASSSTGSQENTEFQEDLLAGIVMCSIVLVAQTCFVYFSFAPRVSKAESAQARGEVLRNFLYSFGLRFGMSCGQSTHDVSWHANVFLAGEGALAVLRLAMCVMKERMEVFDIGGDGGPKRRNAAAGSFVVLYLLLGASAVLLMNSSLYFFSQYPSPLTLHKFVRDWKHGPWLIKAGWHGLLKYDVVAFFLDMSLLAFRLLMEGTTEGEFSFRQKRIINALFQWEEDIVSLAVACLGLVQILNAWALKSFLFRESFMTGFIMCHVYHVKIVCSRIWRARALARNIDAQFPDSTPEEILRKAQDVCAVCLKSMQAGYSDRVKRLPCRHHLHRDCLLQVLKSGQGGTDEMALGLGAPVQPRCPLCRELANEKNDKGKKKKNKKEQQPGARRRAAGGEGTAGTASITGA